MSGLKIVVIGGGSSYTPELIEGLLNRYHEMPVASLWLVDIEEGKEKVEIIAGLARRMIAKAGLTIEVVATLDRESALRDADFVCSQFRAGCLDARISDERISLKYGLIGQETNGLGGFAHACRPIPIALEIAADMERLCPDAWLLNFTNPSGMVTEAILRHSRIKAVGLCNVPVIMQKGITTLLQCADEKEVVMQVAGLNHFIFVRQILHKGKEWLPEVIAEINAGRDPLVPRNIPPFRWPSHLLQGLGMIPCAYLRYYYMKDDLLRQELAEAGGEGTRGEVVKQLDGMIIRGQQVVAKQLPCVFGEALTVLKAALETYQPRLTIAVGQAGGRVDITVERVAINVDDARIPDNKGQQPIDEPIVANGPAACFSTLPIKAIVSALRQQGIPASVSQTAGTFVCNHVMYGLLHQLQGKSGQKGGFIHIPSQPDQAAAHPGQASMAVAPVRAALETAIAVALEQNDDVKIGGGATH